MINLDPAKLLVILVVALIVLGPDRLPQVARQMAGVWKELTRIREQVTDEVRAAMPDIDIPHIPSPSGAISGFLNNLTGPPKATGNEPTSSVGDPSVPGTDATATTAPAASGAGTGERRRTAPRVVIHPNLGDVAFLPEDPGMN